MTANAEEVFTIRVSADGTSTYLRIFYSDRYTVGMDTAKFT